MRGTFPKADFGCRKFSKIANLFLDRGGCGSAVWLPPLAVVQHNRRCDFEFVIEITAEGG